MSSLQLTLLHTNDLHGRVNQLTRIGTLVRGIRREVGSAGACCLYFDAGDSEDSILLESALTQGSAMEAILRSAGCDQAALGNAIPFRYGIEAIRGLSESFGKPLLCGNMHWPDGSIPAGLLPYVIEEVGGVKLAVIGLTAPMDAYQPFKIVIDSPIQILPELIGRVKAEGAQLVILLSHLGQKQDIELLESVTGVDVVIGGHSHDRVNPPLLVNGALILQAGQYGEVLGRLDLDINKYSGRIRRYSAQLIPVEDSTPEDAEVLEAVSQQKQRAQRIMDIEIGTLTEDISFVEGEECQAGNLLADALLACYPEAHAAFVMGEHWEEGLITGRLTKGALYSANRSTGNPGRIRVTGEQLEQFFTAALKKENITKRSPQMRGRMNGMPHVAGMRVIAHGREPGRVEILIREIRLQPHDVITAITSDYEISEILNYLPIPDEQVDYDIPTILPQVLETYIRNRSPIGRVEGGRIIYRDQA
ncbi:MAG TPA: bifunctional UDP-sugar hydrolase/5'-nucleotidase [Anaerolineaceae bacterium]|nr:bifunctional UDP-sugar hydrolase/5'-nucleotidase [Anaerolineaceae bacterium]